MSTPIQSIKSNGQGKAYCPQFRTTDSSIDCPLPRVDSTGAHGVCVGLICTAQPAPNRTDLATAYHNGAALSGWHRAINEVRGQFAVCKSPVTWPAATAGGRFKRVQFYPTSKADSHYMKLSGPNDQGLPEKPHIQLTWVSMVYSNKAERNGTHPRTPDTQRITAQPATRTRHIPSV